ncbi:hypothetical protein CFP71_13570 [Amycolatopsis thailandensis]|uniref:Uncharacterized protein n=1 Tax=Amycolatopsis thailandensis TaxID=589330 RepID=A0A229SC12_9PSEU|nr:hypothetical protein [Amycolatopsis thailandensis]OXM56438.1 hypothetical protein CFP71_13570 [Amycolatopsis thailandensis]
MNSENRQSFDAFMASVGAQAQTYLEAFATAQREGHPRFGDYLTPGAGAAETPATYRTSHLTTFWDDQSCGRLGEFLAGWLESPVSSDDAASRWGMLHRRLNDPLHLAAFVERIHRSPPHRGASFDAALDNALAQLRSSRAQEGAEFLAPVITRLYARAGTLGLLG